MESLRKPKDLVRVAHEHKPRAGKPGKQGAIPVQPGFGGTVFASAAGADLAAAHVADQLHPVADAQDGDAQIQDASMAGGSPGTVDAVRPAGKNNPRRSHGPDLLRGDAAGADLGIDPRLPDTPGDQFLVLPAKI